MKHVIPHDLEMSLAKRVADRAFAEYKSRFPDYHPSLLWVSDQRANIAFSARGIKLAGAMLIEARAIALELDVPFLFRPFQKTAIEVIEREVNVWLERARAGEL
jgi:hypothetical protein